MDDSRSDGKEKRKLALFGHGLCGSSFFAEPTDPEAYMYHGRCPNPRCNKYVALPPWELYKSTDKARREYIRKSQAELDPIFWQT